MAAIPLAFSDKNKTYVFDGAKLEEQKRLERQGEGLNKLLHNEPFRAGLSNCTPSKILEIGCGTGMMTSRLGQLYPSSKVYGIDPTPVPGIHPQPSNVEYLQGTFEALFEAGDSRLEAGTFDYVFIRLLQFVITDWPLFLSRISELLKPGGSVEVQEWEGFGFYSANDKDSVKGKGSVPQNLAWLATIRSGFAARRLNIEIAPQLKDMMLRLGLAKVASERFNMPIAPYDEQQKETKAISVYMREMLPPFVDGIMQRFLSDSHSEEDIREFKEQAMRDLWPEERGGDTVHWWFYVTVGQKPVQT